MKKKFGSLKNLTEFFTSKWGIFLLLATSAVLTALTLIFEFLSFAVFFSLAPLVIVLIKRCEKYENNRKKLFSSYGIGFIWSFFFYIIIYHWFWYLWPMDFLGVDKPLAFLITVFCWIGLTVLQTIGTAFVAPLFCLAYNNKRSRTWLLPLIFASAWTFLEYMQSLTWMGVPWARLALSQASFPAAVQSASLLGSLFIGFIIAFVNAFVALSALSFIREGKASKNAMRFACVALAVVIFNLGYGFIALAANNEKSGEKLTVTVIQGNIASGDKWEVQSNANSMKVYRELTLEADKKEHADIVLWPETIITTYVKDSTVYRNELLSLAKETGSVIFVGAFDYTEAYEDRDGDGEKESVDLEHNAVIAFFPDGSIEESSYKKQHLVPFGEYMPMRDFLSVVLPFMTELNMLESDLAAGESSEIVDTGFGKAGRLICFDSIYPSLTRKSVADGAEFILLSTNDSWYRNSASAYQHNLHAVLRAVENRRYIARAASTGISAVITSDGKTLEMIPPMTKGYATSEIYTNTSRTLYSYVGDVIAAMSAFVIVLFVLKDIFGRKKEDLVKMHKNIPSTLLK